MKFSVFTLLSCSLFFFNHQPFSNAQSNTLTPGQSITDGQTLVSAANIFVLGFFSPGNSTSRYVGIWYHNITQTIVWVANRQSPLTNRSGSITLTSTGSLAVIDGAGLTIWSTNSPPTSNSTAAAFLMDSGNLVIRRADRKITWNSFNYPTDTFIPGMTMTLNRRTGSNQLLTSWKSVDDPSIGNYSLGLDPSGSGHIYIWDGEKIRWRSGQWNGETFIGTMMRPLYLYGFKLVSDINQGIMYFTFAAFNSSILRFQLDSNGIEDTTMSVGDGWKSVWVQPGNECEFYGKCGRYGVCAYDGHEAKCSCLKGFEMSANSTAGCARKIPLQCSSSTNGSSDVEGDGFFQVAAVKLPDHSNWETTVVSEADCRTTCLNNCSCEAYAYPTNIGCLIWSRELIDIYEFPQGGSVLYLKLPDSELGSPKRKWKIIVITSTIGAAIFIVCFFFLWKYSGRIKGWSRKRESLSTILRFSQEVKPAFSGPSEGGEEGRQEGTSSELPFYSFSQLSTATNKFGDSNMLGQGGFGHVYKGILPGGQEIAVKRLSAGSGQGHEEFKNEVILIARLQHRNLVRLLGCCIEGEEKILVYEYMPNKSLDAFLFEPQKQALLDWTIRFSIIEGIVRGLLYLHRDSRLRIVHRDLKASNILLDEHMNPKISDFGMARIFRGDENQANTNRMVGTYGYMSPEYAMEGLFSVKSDVYSFGVLVLEIVIGRRNSSFHLIESSLNIVGYAWRFWSEGKAEELIDEPIRNSCPIDQVLRCIHLALLCVQDHVNARPDMAEVVLMLVSGNAKLSAPEQPMFASVTEGPSRMAALNKNETFSVNDMSITVVEGR